MASYHEDMTCGACCGPLEDDRNAICHACAPESDWFRGAADAQEVSRHLRRAQEGWLKRLFRRILCKLYIRCDVEEKWWAKETSGLTSFSAALYGCVEQDGKYLYYQCRICKSIMAPFEVHERGWA